MGTCLLQQKVDIYKLSGGKNRAINLYFPIKYFKNNIFYENRICDQSFNKETGELQLEFEHINVDNPMVSAIILLKGTLEGNFIRHWLLLNKINNGRFWWNLCWRITSKRFWKV